MSDPRLIQAVQELDPGTRALLDLSLRRAIADEKVAELLGVELSEIPRRRARGLAELADKLEVPGPAELALLLVAIPGLPESAWEVPAPKLPKPPRKVSKARRARAFRRAAVAASPLVAAAAVMAALIVSGGTQKDALPGVAAPAGHGPGHGVSAATASARAPQSADPRHSLPRGTGVASLWGPTPAQLFAGVESQKRAARARHGQSSAGPLAGDHFASAAPRPDNFVHYAPEVPTQHQAPPTVAVPETPIAPPPQEQPQQTFTTPPEPVDLPVVQPPVTPPVDVTPPKPAPVQLPVDVQLPPVVDVPTTPPVDVPAVTPPPPSDQGGGCADGQTQAPPPSDGSTMPTDSTSSSTPDGSTPPPADPPPADPPPADPPPVDPPPADTTPPPDTTTTAPADTTITSAADTGTSTVTDTPPVDPPPADPPPVDPPPADPPPPDQAASTVQQDSTPAPVTTDPPATTDSAPPVDGSSPPASDPDSSVFKTRAETSRSQLPDPQGSPSPQGA